MFFNRLNSKHYIGFIVFLVLCALLIVHSGSSRSAVIDTYFEDFDAREDDASIDGVDSWSVSQGSVANAVTQDSTTYTGSGKALELTGAETSVNIARSTTYGDLSPCWIEFIINPGLGSERRDIPSGKITALSFDYTGKIYAADGSSWTDTGETFTPGEWYSVILKLDFKTHLYDIYIESLLAPETEFIPDKENLDFIDSSISSLSNIGFEGVYSATSTDETYIDDLVVHFIDRLGIVTPPQSIVEEEASTPIIVQLQNSYSETQTAWCDITLELKSSSSTGQFSIDKDIWSPVEQVVIPEDAQSVTFYYKDSTIGKPIIGVSEYPDRGWEDALQQQDILSKTASFDVEVTTPHVAGESFTILITAKNEEGELDEFYSGEVEILVDYVSPDTGTKEITPNTISGFNNGMLEVEAQYPDCGVVEIIVQDMQDSSKIGYSGEILFIPYGFSVSAGTPQVVSKEFQLEVAALNAEGNVCLNHKRSVGLSVIPILPETTSGKLSPAVINPGDFSDGAVSFSLSFDRWGTIKIEAYVLNYPARTGISEAIFFQPSSLLIEIEPSLDRDFYYIGENINISVSALDELEAAIPNYQGLINISTTLGLTLPSEYQFTELDIGAHEFVTSVSSAGFYELSVEDTLGHVKASSPKFEVKGATLEVVSTFSPVGTTEVIIKLVDEEGNIISSESALPLTVELQEENANSSAGSSAIDEPVVFTKGIARVLVSDTEIEVVNILPSSSFDFKIKPGSVTFGRVAKTGIGTLMWREIKE